MDLLHKLNQNMLVIWLTLEGAHSTTFAMLWKRLSDLYLCTEIEEFLKVISAFFSYHIEFCEISSHIQETFHMEKYQLIRYCGVRFLSIYPVEKMIEQYKAIEKLFLDEKLFPRLETIHLLYDMQVDIFQTALIYFCPV